MSKVISLKRITAPDLRKRKSGEPIVALTSYHAHTAALIDPFVDLILVGDSLGMVMHGYQTTVPVPLELMIAHGKAVMRGSERALVAVDMPFGSYEESPQQAFANAARVVKETGAGAIKLEGGKLMAPTIEFITQRGIPVIAHVGMTPQSILNFGTFNSRGKTDSESQSILEDAKAVASAGAFACVVEAVQEPLARTITQSIDIPTIGIGASNTCDGQILVLEDMLGLSDHTPKFVRKYARLKEAIETAVSGYASDVRSRAFPGEENVFIAKTPNHKS